MTEAMIHVRQMDGSRASNKGQKRPLSIITENDSDDIDVLEYTTYQTITDSNDNIVYSENISESNTCIKNNEILSGILEPSLNPICSSLESENDISSRKSSPIVRPELIVIESLVDISKPIISATASLLLESSVSILEPSCDCRLGDEEINSTDKCCSKQHTECKHHQYCLPLVTIQDHTSTSCNATQIDSHACPRPDYDSLARNRETAEHHHQTLPLPSTSPSLATLNSLFGNRHRIQTLSPRTLQQIKSSAGQHFQQLPVTNNRGTPIGISLFLAPNPDYDITGTNNSTFLSDITENSSLTQSHINRSTILSNQKLRSSKLSSFFSRRMSNESTGSLSETELSDGDIGSEDGQSTYRSHFRLLQETTDKLHLSTRRPSIMLWREQCLDFQGSSPRSQNQYGDVSDDSLTSDKSRKLISLWNGCEINWYITGQEMRSQDQNLARQLLAIRHDIHKLKLQRSTEEHQELIDDFHFELQEIQEFSDVLDLPLSEYGDNPLKHIGVTRHNISARRFSAC